MKPFFYTCQASRLIFAPEMKGILCDETFPRKLDLTALRRMVDDEFGQASAWASRLLDDWQVLRMCEK